MRLFIILFFPTLLFSKNDIVTKPKPNWVLALYSITNDNVKASQVSDGYRYLTIDVQYHLENQETYYHYTRKIYSEAGVQNASEINIQYDPTYQKLVLH